MEMIQDVGRGGGLDLVDDFALSPSNQLNP